MKDEKNSENHTPTIRAMVWYKEEDWEKLLGMFTDSHLLPKTHKDWLKRAEEMVEQKELAPGATPAGESDADLLIDDEPTTIRPTSLTVGPLNSTYG